MNQLRTQVRNDNQEYDAGTIHANEFKNFGFISVKISQEKLVPFELEVNKIQGDFESAEKYNGVLAGNIKREYKMSKDTTEYASNLILPYVIAYEQHYNILKANPVLSDKTDWNISLENLWANFQQKHEFNPPHIHGGVMSFVIWLRIPFYMEDELKVSPGGLVSRDPLAGHFAFQYTNTLGQIVPHAIPADKTMEGMLVLFPAGMSHTVFPFYSSDDYRVTISGNFIVNPPEKK